MQGDKTAAALGIFPSAAGSEGSLRNHLTVWGPGVPSGAIDDSLLTLADVLPTMAELANASNTQHRPLSGRSFANLLVEGGKRRWSQGSRFHFVLAVSADKGQCPPLMDLMHRQLPDLGPDRCVCVRVCVREVLMFVHVREDVLTVLIWAWMRCSCL
jgi:hypothetical protein